MVDRYRIRLAEPNDLRAVARIERDVFPSPWAARDFSMMLGPWFLVAERGDVVAGYVVGRLTAGEGEILNIAVDEGHRRAGLGTSLLLTLLQSLADNGAEAVYLEVRASNRAALRMYRECGFYQVGRRARYYSDPVEDALVLKRDFGL